MMHICRYASISYLLPFAFMYVCNTNEYMLVDIQKSVFTFRVDCIFAASTQSLCQLDFMMAPPTASAAQIAVFGVCFWW